MQTKRMLIINRPKSKYIEQAFFILKSDKDNTKLDSIIDEAYDIINQQCEMDVYYTSGRVSFFAKLKNFLKALWF